MDMLNGRLTKNILLFTLPIALSSMLQQLFHAADTMIVGYFDDANALAAVGTNGEIIALIVTLSSGLAIGANVLVAGQIGKKELTSLSHIVPAALFLAVLIGITGMAAGQLLTSPVLRLIHTPSDILSSATSYLRLYLLGYPFLLLYDFGSALLRARGDSRYPFFALTIAGALNVVLNIFFVIFLHWGVCGVALATDLSTLVSALLVLHRLKKEFPLFLPSLEAIRKELPHILSILKIGIPSAIQGAVFCFANIFVQATVNEFGSVTIAGSTIAMNFEYFTYYVITAFGQTATTFTSQNYAAGQKKRCFRIFLLCMLYSVLALLLLIVPLVVFRRFFCGFFSTDNAVITQACLRILCILFYEPLCCLYEIPAGSLRGSGHALLPAITTIVGTCVFRILWIFLIFPHHATQEMLYHAFPLSWVLTLIMMLSGLWICHPFSVKKDSP